jgi:ABC-2 type transport system permease protein
LAASSTLVGGAVGLSNRRDLGAGLFHTRPGPDSASRSLTRPLGLDWRLLRATTLAWVVAIFVTGVVFGSIAKDADKMIVDNPQLADIFAQLHTGSITDSFFETTMMMLGLLTAGFSISAMLIPHSEERAGRLEPLLATPRSRSRWLTGHLFVTIAGSIVIVAAGGLGVGVAYAIAVHDIGQIPRLVGASLVTVPAGLVLIGAATALFGLMPRATVAVWALLAGCAVVGFLGALLQLPNWARHLSPFEQLPSVPAEPLAIQPLGTLGAIAAALIAAGIWGLRRRDIPA